MNGWLFAAAAAVGVLAGLSAGEHARDRLRARKDHWETQCFLARRAANEWKRAYDDTAALRSTNVRLAHSLECSEAAREQLVEQMRAMQQHPSRRGER